LSNVWTVPLSFTKALPVSLQRGNVRGTRRSGRKLEVSERKTRAKSEAAAFQRKTYI
jgi:hypothetical protein